MMSSIFNSSEKTNSDYSILTGIVVLYIVTVAVAATVILPNEENIVAGLIKSIIWPLYSITRILG